MRKSSISFYHQTYNILALSVKFSEKPSHTFSHNTYIRMNYPYHWKWEKSVMCHGTHSMLYTIFSHKVEVILILNLTLLTEWWLLLLLFEMCILLLLVKCSIKSMKTRLSFNFCVILFFAHIIFVSCFKTQVISTKFTSSFVGYFPYHFVCIFIFFVIVNVCFFFPLAAYTTHSG